VGPHQCPNLASGTTPALASAQDIFESESSEANPASLLRRGVTIGIVGYRNIGKSSLINTLPGASSHFPGLNYLSHDVYIVVVRFAIEAQALQLSHEGVVVSSTRRWSADRRLASCQCSCAT
jgi:ribosome-interacting GTPase 1